MIGRRGAEGRAGASAAPSPSPPTRAPWAGLLPAPDTPRAPRGPRPCRPSARSGVHREHSGGRQPRAPPLSSCLLQNRRCPLHRQRRREPRASVPPLLGGGSGAGPWEGLVVFVSTPPLATAAAPRSAPPPLGDRHLLWSGCPSVRVPAESGCPLLCTHWPSSSPPPRSLARPGGGAEGRASCLWQDASSPRPPPPPPSSPPALCSPPLGEKVMWPVNGSALPPPSAAAGMGGFEVLVRLVTAATHNSPCQSVRQHVPHQPAVKESLRVAGAAGKSPPPPLGAAPTSGFAGGGALGLQTKDETTQLPVS